MQITLNKLIQTIHEYSEPRKPLSIGMKVKYNAIRVGFKFNDTEIIDVNVDTTNLHQLQDTLRYWTTNENNSSLYFIYRADSETVIPPKALTTILQTIVGSAISIPQCNILISIIDMLSDCGYQVVYKSDEKIIYNMSILDEKRREIEYLEKEIIRAEKKLDTRLNAQLVTTGN